MPLSQHFANIGSVKPFQVVVLMIFLSHLGVLIESSIVLFEFKSTDSLDPYILLQFKPQNSLWKNEESYNICFIGIKRLNYFHINQFTKLS
jgi:hypothetical protein